MASILPFPLARRAALVKKCAKRMIDFDHDVAEAHLARAIQTQRDAMERRGVQNAVVRRELAAFEAAVRAELWQQVLAPGGSA